MHKSADESAGKHFTPIMDRDKQHSLIIFFFFFFQKKPNNHSNFTQHSILTSEHTLDIPNFV